jgi:hypothetical protein
MNRSLNILILSLAAVAMTVSSSASAQGGAQDFLTISGNQVMLNGQRPISLHGVAVGNPYFRESSDKRTIDDYRTIKDWQANVVRLSVHPGVYMKDEQAVKKALRKEVAAARNNGLFVIIDWHVIGVPDKSFKAWPQGRYSGVLYDSDLDRARNFWQYIASEYGNDRGVIFELWNESYDYAGSQPNWNDLRPSMQCLYDAVRQAGAQNIVLAPGVSWSYDLRGIKNNPLQGYNIGYVWHNYPDSSKCLSWDQALDGLHKQYPVFVTEWGFSTETSGQHFSLTGTSNSYPEKLKNYIIDNDLHSTAWVWSATSDPKMFTADWRTLTAYGRFVKAFLINASHGIFAAAPGYVADSSYSLMPELQPSCDAYKNAFGKVAMSESELADVRRIHNSAYPLKRNAGSESRMSQLFEKIYKRKPDMENANDLKAMMIMTYGVKIRKTELDPQKEKIAGATYFRVFGHKPLSLTDKNVFRAIAYSKAKR